MRKGFFWLFVGGGIVLLPFSFAGNQRGIGTLWLNCQSYSAIITLQHSFSTKMRNNVKHSCNAISSPNIQKLSLVYLIRKRCFIAWSSSNFFKQVMSKLFAPECDIGNDDKWSPKWVLNVIFCFLRRRIEWWITTYLLL